MPRQIPDRSPDPLMSSRPPVPTSRPEIRLTISGYDAIRKDEDYLKGKWRDESLCVKVCEELPKDFKPGDWFPTTPSGQYSKAFVPSKVKAVCHECPVRIECLVYAIATNQSEGVWAGHAAKTINRMRLRIKGQ